MKITVLGPLPPRKGVSEYMVGFIGALTVQAFVQVLDFSSMYPKKFYPGGDPKQEHAHVPSFTNWMHQPTLVWRNPITWVKAGLSIQGSVLHMQYWIWFLAPIYISVGCIARWWKKIPVIITIHNVQPHEKSIWKGLIDKSVYAVADAFIVHSEENKVQLEKLIGKKTIHVFPHGIIAPKVGKMSTSEAKVILDITLERKGILFFGNIRPYKGLSVMIEAFHRCIQKNNPYVLIIAGKSWEDWSTYEALIQHYGLEKHIIRIDKFLDDQETTTVFSASELMVLPYTHFDAQSGVVALGLGYEIPMIVSDLGGLTEVIDDQRYIWDGKSPDSLAEIILKNDCAEATQYIISRKKLFDRKIIVQEYLLFITNKLK